MRRTDEDEYGEFVTARYDALRRFGYLMCGDWHRAEDAVANALTKLYVVWARVRGRGTVDAYVRRIVVTCLVDEHRRGFNRRERPSPRTPDRPTADHSDRIDQRVSAGAALAALPPGQRAAIVLRYWEDLSLEQTATVLDCSVGTVKSQCARGLRTLRELLATETAPDMWERSTR